MAARTEIVTPSEIVLPPNARALSLGAPQPGIASSFGAMYSEGRPSRGRPDDGFRRILQHSSYERTRDTHRAARRTETFQSVFSGIEELHGSNVNGFRGNMAVLSKRQQGIILTELAQMDKDASLKWGDIVGDKIKSLEAPFRKMHLVLERLSGAGIIGDATIVSAFFGFYSRPLRVSSKASST